VLFPAAIVVALKIPIIRVENEPKPIYRVLVISLASDEPLYSLRKIIYYSLVVGSYIFLLVMQMSGYIAKK
jgi:hypothetical protein